MELNILLKVREHWNYAKNYTNTGLVANPMKKRMSGMEKDRLLREKLSESLTFENSEWCNMGEEYSREKK